MSEQEQRIAIAEACDIVFKNPWGSVYKTRKGVSIECPDYCNDLNEMHEAEKVLFGEIASTYAEWLSKTTGAEWSVDKKFFCATASQRAEAFLRTVGKWTTNPNEQ